MFWFIDTARTLASILFLLFLSGSLIQICLLAIPKFRNVCSGPIEIVVNAFLISICLNSALSAIFSLAGIGLSNVKYALLFLNLALLFWLILSVKPWRTKRLAVRLDTLDKMLALLVALVFILLSVQGGLLDIMADGWWHMSIANRMIQENTLLLQFHPFANVQSTGFEIFYPPLWHLQLALISEVSGVILPWVWHFVAAVNVSMLLLIFYKLSLVLSQDRRVAFGAVCLHIVLVGGLNTYFRVGSWPANAAYVLLYYAIYQTFFMLTSATNQSLRVGQRGFPFDFGRFVLLVMACIAMVGLHGVELVLFVLSIGAYLIGISVVDILNRSSIYTTERNILLVIFASCLLVGLFGAFLLMPARIMEVLLYFKTPRPGEPYLNFFAAAGTILIIFVVAFVFRGGKIERSRTRLKIGFSITLCAIFAFIIDFSHLRDLFFPTVSGAHIPYDFLDRFDNQVFLPFWDHQLRGGLIYSGLASIAGALVMLFARGDRASIFVGTNALLALLILVSPYLFAFMSFLLPLKSVYRVQILIFSPLILSMFFSWIWGGFSLRMKVGS